MPIIIPMNTSGLANAPSNELWAMTIIFPFVGAVVVYIMIGLIEQNWGWKVQDEWGQSALKAAIYGFLGTLGLEVLIALTILAIDSLSSIL